MKKALIVGAGVAGKTLAEDLRKHGYEVVGFLDDEQSGGEILGKLAEVNAVINANNVSHLYVAIPSAPSEVIREFINSIVIEGIEIAIIPRSFKIISKDTVSISDLKPVDILNIIGREPIKHDLLEAQKQIHDKVVMITGAAGSIGSELVRQASLLKARQIICVDWWENGMFYLKEELEKQANLEYVIANIQSKDKISTILKQYKPDVIFHAAAYKHVPLMQANPLEAFNNNVWGSLNIMQLAIEHDVHDFVYVSTDKAVNPVNVMGATKRIGEMLLEVLADRQTGTKLSAVRFGNVIASNGSVVPIFQRQIERGGPVKVTHKDVTRYFMTIDEAVQLIIQAWTLGKTSEIFVLDMGEPIKIYELVQNMIKLSGKDVEIEITGLRPGEKMFEELSFNADDVEKTSHEKIFINKNEQQFDHNQLLANVNALLEKTQTYQISDDQLIVEINKLGFEIKSER